MSAVFGALRKHALAPSLDDVTFARRGFPARPTPEARNLESIPQHVILGFEFGMEFGIGIENLGVSRCPARFRRFKIRHDHIVELVLGG